ncbi:MAG: LLM class flavin-dependent oxidoreductase [Candidatus Binatia bacterium]|nr:LLM class flavin-dependent oxidoreductase [Candidatus Binatia bacterium]
MKFGMLHLLENPAGKTEYQVVHEQPEIPQAAEELGFDSVWPAEHHFSEYGYCVSTALMLAALVPVTHRIRLGTGIVILPFHNPVRVAEEFALLDLMSDGRVDFGVGRGYQPHEFRGYGVDQTQSRSLFQESLEIILQAWTKERVNFSGRHFKIEDLPVRPKPLQKPHALVWMAALSPESFVTAGEKGFNLLCAPVFGFGGRSGVENLQAHREALRRHGHDPANKQVAALIMIYVGDSAEQAARDFADPVIWYYRTFAKYIAPPPCEQPIKTYEPYVGVRDMAAQVTWEQLQMAGAVVCGSPIECVERIRQLHSLFGFTTLLCWTRLGGLDHRKVLHSMELMQRYVIPALRDLQSERAVA